MHRVHATVRSAFATAKRRRLISINPAIDIDLPSARRPKVKPWEPAELGKFLDAIAADEMGPLFETVAATGCRRGEVAGMRWDDVDLETRDLDGSPAARRAVPRPGDAVPSLRRGRTRVRRSGRPRRSRARTGSIELDGGVVGVLLAHRLRQDAEKATWGDLYVDHGLVFAQADGSPIPPNSITKRFADLVDGTRSSGSPRPHAAPRPGQPDAGRRRPDGGRQ